jgi:hypothetical protein
MVYNAKIHAREGEGSIGEVRGLERNIDAD